MICSGRWQPGVGHSGAEAASFVSSYFAQEDRKTLLIAGSGFDPRAPVVAGVLGRAGCSVQGLWVQEARSGTNASLAERAAENLEKLQAAVPDNAVVHVSVFSGDGAVVGGQHIVTAVSRVNTDDITDVIIDVSALSIGLSFPVIRYLVELSASGRGPKNVHVCAVSNPKLDSFIGEIPGDVPSFVHGFKGGFTLDAANAAAKLWLPQLAPRRRSALARLYEFVTPHDTCPILPFPARDPRQGDSLIDEYITELSDIWSVDSRNIVYADEEDPLDLYRTILQLHDRRTPVFRECGGSLLILSPLGSKVMALGALMAALERDLPVAYLETVEYEFEPLLWSNSETSSIVHIWLEGSAYPTSRPPFWRRGVAS
jgi:hypothetical protein